MRRSLIVVVAALVALWLFVAAFGFVILKLF